MTPPAVVAAPARRAAFGDYLELCKPKVVAVMIFTAVIGELLAAPGGLPLNALVLGNLGIALAAGSAAAINHLLDRQIDRRMARTHRRPIPSGTVSTRNAAVFAAAIGAAGLGILFVFVNALTALLTFASLMGYAFIYTGFLKRATSQNIVIGGLAGAAPPLLGWTAVTGHVSTLPVLLVTIVFVWTPPHFWPLAIQRQHDYRRVDIPMLPVTHGDRYTRWQIFFYTLLLVAVTVLPTVLGLAGPLYLAGALALGGGFLYHAVAMLVSTDQRRPMRTFRYSITYILALFGALLVDMWVGVVLR